MSQAYDYIICLTGSKIKDQSIPSSDKFGNSDIAALLKDDTENMDPVGTLVEIAYCAYDIK